MARVYAEVSEYCRQKRTKMLVKLVHAETFLCRSQSEMLPRFSSHDFDDNSLGEPMMEVVLSAGDVLYLPRGYIHQAVTEKDFHSLHITVSAYQCNAWIDLLQKVSNLSSVE